jgi:uridine phosphorylase
VFQPVLGKLVRRPAELDNGLAQELKALAAREDPYDTVIGRTMCTYDFYEGNILPETQNFFIN